MVPQIQIREIEVAMRTHREHSAFHNLAPSDCAGDLVHDSVYVDRGLGPIDVYICDMCYLVFEVSEESGVGQEGYPLIPLVTSIPIGG